MEKLSSFIIVLLFAASAFAQEADPLKGALESLRAESRCRFEVAYATDGITISGCFPLDAGKRLPEALVDFFMEHQDAFQADWFTITHKATSLNETFITLQGTGRFTYFVHVNEDQEVVEVQMVDFGARG